MAGRFDQAVPVSAGLSRGRGFLISLRSNMVLPETEHFRVERLLSGFCAKRSPPHLRDQVRVGFRIRGTKVLLYEARPVFLKPDEWVEVKAAQFEYSPATKRWTLYCFDRNSRRRPYYEADENQAFEYLLAEVNEDPTGIFWG